MNLPDTLLDAGWYWAAWLVWLPLLARSVWRAPWKRLKDPGQLHVWMGLIVALMLFWSMKAGVRPGLSLHFLGAMVMTLICGAHLAFLGLSLVLAAVTLNGAAGGFSFALNALLMAGVGVLTAQGVFRLTERFLPQHFFVYVFVNAFFGAAFAVIAVGLAACLLLGFAGVYSFAYLSAEYLPYYLLLGFSEAWLSGMVITLFVVYYPRWVSTFDDSRYLVGK